MDSSPPIAVDASNWVCQTCQFHLGNLRCKLRKLIIVGDGPLERCSGYQPNNENE